MLLAKYAGKEYEFIEHVGDGLTKLRTLGAAPTIKYVQRRNVGPEYHAEEEK